MSYRYSNSFIKPGLNTLTSPSPSSYTYELWSWGLNSSGQLGLNNTTNYSSPKQIGALATWATVSSGAGNATATKTDGTLWSWGRNDYGQLGLGSISNYSSPKQVGALTIWSTIASGFDHVLAIRTDGTLWSWGRNNYGQLGFSSVYTVSYTHLTLPTKA